MPRAKKTNKGKKEFGLFDEDESGEGINEEDLPKDTAGRLKIKRRYEELLGIRTMKLRGRVLNRERINKTIEGIYFVCAECAKVCHSLDEGIVEDPDNIENMCSEEHRKQCQHGKAEIAI